MNLNDLVFEMNKIVKLNPEWGEYNVVTPKYNGSPHEIRPVNSFHIDDVTKQIKFFEWF